MKETDETDHHDESQCDDDETQLHLNETDFYDEHDHDDPVHMMQIMVKIQQRHS